MRHNLSCHPATQARSISSVEADILIDGAQWRIDYLVRGDLCRIAIEPDASRTDGLWRTTCFELFVQPVDDAAYFEFNFSPSTRWAAYGFDSYRQGGRDLVTASPPLVSPAGAGVKVSVDLSLLPPPPWHVSLSAVIEEADGTRSFWALAHPAGKPDFHDAACFVLQVPAVA